MNCSDQTKSSPLGAIKKRYSCDQCDEEFQRQGEMKKHKKEKHILIEKEEVKNENFDNFKVKATLKPKKVKKIRSNINIAIEAKDIFQSAEDPFIEQDDVSMQLKLNCIK